MPQRVIITKYKVYELAADAVGLPVEEYYPDVKTWPEQLKGAKVYQTADGPVVAARPPPSDPNPAEKPARRREPLLLPIDGRKKPTPPPGSTRRQRPPKPQS